MLGRTCSATRAFTPLPPPLTDSLGGEVAHAALLCPSAAPMFLVFKIHVHYLNKSSNCKHVLEITKGRTCVFSQTIQNYLKRKSYLITSGINLYQDTTLLTQELIVLSLEAVGYRTLQNHVLPIYQIFVGLCTSLYLILAGIDL